MEKPTIFFADVETMNELKTYKATTGKTIKFMLNEALSLYIKGLKHAN